jgi:hypothetical protein
METILAVQVLAIGALLVSQFVVIIGNELRGV